MECTRNSGESACFCGQRPERLDRVGDGVSPVMLGAARFTTSGVGPFSVNFLNMMGLPSGVATVPNPLKIDTGFTVGLGLSTSLGNMLRGFTGPFSGP